ncbi:FHA domain-containing protein [Aphelenchoides fujianensis]|nr:FHA domain-containing protein [Aphelenchoides fujianensis]
MPSMSRSPSPQRSRHRRRRSSSGGRSRSRSPRRSRRDRRDSRSPPPPIPPPSGRSGAAGGARGAARTAPPAGSRAGREAAPRGVGPRDGRAASADRRPKAKLFDPFSGEEKPQSSRGGGGAPRDEKVSKPSFEPSGKLAADTNTFKARRRDQIQRAAGSRQAEAPMASVPDEGECTGEEVMQPIYIHRQSAYLVGETARSPTSPSITRQHAVLQYRSMPFEKNGVPGRRTLPYIIDLGSANGTYLNGERIEAQRYSSSRSRIFSSSASPRASTPFLHELSAEGRGGEALDEELEGDDEIDLEGAEEKLLKQEEDYF